MYLSLVLRKYFVGEIMCMFIMRQIHTLKNAQIAFILPGPKDQRTLQFHPHLSGEYTTQTASEAGRLLRTAT